MVTPTSAVTVKITAPSDQTVVSDSTVVDLTATVDVDNNGTDLVDTSSVKVVVTAGTGAAVISTGQLVSTGGDTFAGTISLGNLQTGNYTITVSAKSLTGVTGHDAITLMVQGGPTLIVNAPAEGQPYSDSVSIQILVDHGASAPTATLAGTGVTLSAPTPSGAYDVYTATVWFRPPPPRPARRPSSSSPESSCSTSRRATGRRPPRSSAPSSSTPPGRPSPRPRPRPERWSVAW